MAAIIIGYIMDLLIGDPQNPFHPVRFIGNFTAFLEKVLRKILPKYLKLCGLILTLITVSITFTITYMIVSYGRKFNYYAGVLIEGIIIYFCISGKGLIYEGLKVIKYVAADDIEGARKALSFIVGRDTKDLDKESIIRAVIETIAENISDGVIAPLFYCAILGAPLAMTYKAVNTMDSMFGYKNEKYIDFGFFPAKFDDVANYIPSRICGIIIIISAFILRYDYKNSFKIFKRDRYNHTSPNSAQPESAMAGALQLRLGGPNYYFGKLVAKPYIGDSLKKIEVSDVYKCSNVLYVSYFIGMVMSIGVRIIILKIM